MSIYAKIAQVKGALGPVLKAEKNTQYGYTYASLTDIFRACNEAMAEVGLTVDITDVIIDKELLEVTQEVYFGVCVNVVDTENGDKIRKVFHFPADDYGKGTRMKHIQAIGSMLTYAQRYIYGALFSIQLENDPDASHAEPVEKEPAKVWLTEEQFNKAKVAPIKQVAAVLAKYSAPNYAMKKAYRQELEAIINNQNENNGSK